MESVGVLERVTKTLDQTLIKTKVKIRKPQILQAQDEGGRVRANHRPTLPKIDGCRL